MAEPTLEFEPGLRELGRQHIVLGLREVGVGLRVRADLPPPLVEL
jgi:hypothetical protein